MMSNEYDDIYRNPVGFLFRVTAHGISEPIALSAEELCEHPPIASNPDELYLCCKTCDVYMIYNSSESDDYDGKWSCPHCGRTVRESTVYRRIEKKNQEFLRKMTE